MDSRITRFILKEEHKCLKKKKGAQHFTRFPGSEISFYFCANSFRVTFSSVQMLFHTQKNDTDSPKSFGNIHCRTVCATEKVEIRMFGAQFSAAVNVDIHPDRVYSV